MPSSGCFLGSERNRVKASDTRKAESQSQEASFIALAHTCLDRELAAAKVEKTTGSIRVELQILDGRANHRPDVHVKKVGK